MSSQHDYNFFFFFFFSSSESESPDKLFISIFCALRFQFYFHFYPDYIHVYSYKHNITNHFGFIKVIFFFFFWNIINPLYAQIATQTRVWAEKKDAPESLFPPKIGTGSGSRWWKTSKGTQFLIFSSIGFQCLLRGVCAMLVNQIFIVQSVHIARRYWREISPFGGCKKLMSPFPGRTAHVTRLTANRIGDDGKIQMNNLFLVTTDSAEKMGRSSSFGNVFAIPCIRLYVTPFVWNAMVSSNWIHISEQ